jgi:hypothetical protein
MKPAKRILEKAKSTEHPIVFHSDKGVQYSSAGYCNLLKSATLFKVYQEPEIRKIKL